MEYRVLGPVEVLREGIPLALGGPKQRALLALLIVHANRAVSAERLADELWGVAAPGDPAAVVQVYVSNLRKVLEPDRAANAAPEVIFTKKPGYMVRVDPDSVDALRFERLASAARRSFAAHHLAKGAGLMREALDLWRGTPLLDVPDHPFVPAQTAPFEARLTAIEGPVRRADGLG